MADNLSSLIPDAFDIYSGSYIAIGQLGVRVVDLAGKPRQPKMINRLIEATMLYSVVSPSITLNEDGTAISGIIGDVAVINNLLLKLKRSVGLYDLAIFPTPLTDIIIALGGGGGGGAGGDETYLTVVTEAGLSQSRRLILGGDAILELADGGAGGNMVLTANILDVASVDTTVSPIVLNMNSLKERLFLGSANIASIKTWSFSNVTNAKRFYFTFVISGTILGASHDQTMPANVKMSDARIVPLSSPKKWRPIDTGEYEAVATTYDNGVTWKLTISNDVFS
jgi:hypothetical protein